MTTFDPFSDLPDLDVHSAQIHIRLQQRSARKCITIVEGLDKDVSKKVITALRSKLGCSGTDKGGAIQFSGDQRQKIIGYLTENKIVESRNIVQHGW